MDMVYGCNTTLTDFYKNYRYEDFWYEYGAMRSFSTAVELFVLLVLLDMS